jgi:protein required for attachment to host cells
MDVTWIVAANAGRARFFSQTRARERPEEINDMVNTASRLRNSDIESDAQGQRAASKSRHSVGAPTQPSGYEPNQSPTEHQTELFARGVAASLLDAQQQGRYQRLVLVASPEFLGTLRKLLDRNVAAAVTLEINKDYSQLNPDELGEQLRVHLEKR